MEPQRRAWLAAALLLRGNILASAGRRPEAATSFRQALAVFGQLAAEQPHNPEHRRQLASTQVGLAAHHLDLDFYAKYFKAGACGRTHLAHRETWHPSEEAPSRT